MFVEIFEESMRSPSLGAQDRVSACKLAGQTLLCLKGHMDEVRSRGCGHSYAKLSLSLSQFLHRYVDVAVQFVLREDTKTEPIITSELHVNCIELVVTALYYSPPLTLSLLQKSNTLQPFFSQWLNKLSHFTRVHDRKICILAITSIFSTVPAEVSSIPGLSEQLIRAALSLFEGLPKALSRRKQLEEDFDKEDDDDDDDEDDDDFGEGVDVGDEEDVYDEDNEYQELLASKQVRV